MTQLEWFNGHMVDTPVLEEGQETVNVIVAYQKRDETFGTLPAVYAGEHFYRLIEYAEFGDLAEIIDDRVYMWCYFPSYP